MGYRIAALFFSTLVAWPCIAIAQSIDAARSQVTILSRQMNVPVEASFKKFTAQIAFDPNKPETGKARIEIDLNSFDIGDPEIIDALKEPNWFDSKKYPTAVFVSSSVRALGGDRYEARGPLTLKGRTQEVVAPFTVRASGADRIFDGAFPVRRLQYNVGDKHWRDTSVVADEVQIRFKLYQTASKPPGK
jgi:polyisoprenoid-binding protein YceI